MSAETILVVEDEATLRLLLTTVLARRGYRVLSATGAAEALEIWHRHARQVHLAIVDCTLPGGMSGPDLAIRLRTEQPQLKILLTSGYGDTITSEGFQFLAKPFTPESLIKAVHSLLPEKVPFLPQ